MNANGLALSSGSTAAATGMGAAGAAGGNFDADRMPPPKVFRCTRETVLFTNNLIVDFHTALF